jgi:hypothetical protein
MAPLRVKKCLGDATEEESRDITRTTSNENCCNIMMCRSFSTVFEAEDWPN